MQLSHNMSLIIIMPRSLSQNLVEVEKRLSADVLMAVMSKLESVPFRPTIVTLPKFKVASSQDLISIVQRLGKVTLGVGRLETRSYVKHMNKAFQGTTYWERLNTPFWQPQIRPTFQEAY